DGLVAVGAPVAGGQGKRPPRGEDPRVARRHVGDPRRGPPGRAPRVERSPAGGDEHVLARDVQPPRRTCLVPHVRALLAGAEVPPQERARALEDGGAPGRRQAAPPWASIALTWSRRSSTTDRIAPSSRSHTASAGRSRPRSSRPCTRAQSRRRNASRTPSAGP